MKVSRQCAAFVISVGSFVSAVLVLSSDCWLVDGTADISAGLWRRCYRQEDLCSDSALDLLADDDWFHVCRFLSITAVVTSWLSSCVFLLLFLQLVTSPDGQQLTKLTIIISHSFTAMSSGLCLAVFLGYLTTGSVAELLGTPPRAHGSTRPLGWATYLLTVVCTTALTTAVILITTLNSPKVRPDTGSKNGKDSKDNKDRRESKDTREEDPHTGNGHVIEEEDDDDHQEMF